MTKWYIQYPINTHCNLMCSYCFHKEQHKSGIYQDRCGFTIKEYQQWRDKFLSDAEEILISLTGGETFDIRNQDEVDLILKLFNKEKFDLLTNGISPTHRYEHLEKYKHKIKRIGCTFHGTQLNEHQKELFIHNVLILKEMGFNVYVKELLMHQHRQNTLNNIQFWKNKGIEVKCQDFRPDGTHTAPYDQIDIAMIDNEYKHLGTECYCRDGYRNLIFLGYGSKPDFKTDGDVLGCWRDQCVIGNIKQMWFNPEYIVKRNHMIYGYDIANVPKLYRGTYFRGSDPTKPNTDTKEYYDELQ